MHQKECTNCGEELDISFELLRLLRYLRENEIIHNDHYMQVVRKLDLPDPNRLMRKKSQELLNRRFELREQIRKCDDPEQEKALKAELEAVKQEWKAIN